MRGQPLKRKPIAFAVHLIFVGVLCVLNQPAPSLAQGTASEARAAILDFDIAAGDLATALRQVASQAGVILSFTPEQTQGKKTAGLQGRHTVLQALNNLLTGTGLQAERNANGSYALRAGTTEQPSVLPAVTVHGTGSEEHALGPVKGYVASRSITATKSDIPLMETAQTVNIVTADQIEIQNAESLSQALQYTAGVHALGGENTTSDGMVIRGFNVTGSAPMYLNGTKLTRNTFSGVSEPYAMERIELLKGPASVLYGNAAPGGIINMVTKQPQLETLRELKLQLGSFDRKQIAGDFSGKITEDGSLSYRFTGLVRRSDTATDYANDDRNFGAASIRWQPTDDTSLTLFANLQDNDTVSVYGLPFEGTAVANPNGRIAHDRFIGEPGFNRFDSENQTLGYLLSHKLNETLTFRQNLLYFHGRTNHADIWMDGFSTADQRNILRGAYTRDDKDRSFSIDNQLEAKWRSGNIENTTLIGVDYSRQRFDRVQYGGSVAMLDVYSPIYGSPVTLNATPQTDGLDKSRQLGLYAQQHMKFDDRWVLTLGGRYDKVDASYDDRISGASETVFDDNAFTGRIGLVRLFENGWAPYVSYSQSFEPSSGRSFSGNAFKPTEGEQYEIGIRYRPPGANHSFTASVYELTQQNVTTTDLANPGYSIQEGEIRSRGLELEAHAQFDNGLNLIASYAYIDNAVTKSNSGTEGNREGGVPRNMAALWLDYRMNDALSFGGGVRYFGSSKNFTNTVDVSSYTVMDAVASYRFTPEWLLSLNLTNILDKRYVTCSYACFYGTPRSAIATLTYRW
ncbi:ferric siderophore receptor [Oxalicibacterium flavum]|uniref:Ferric siderophore receptor n=1 Tax=Oxalicibacterium flavum TaxID=179467 RepID=A0A8J2UP06_9BURK|nr:TonB-dependent siderophore receptor [Oxalicibacterium flavum]GGC09756.1 ferric siderophore receptor [Oxalicibacterium flavum]